MINIIEYSLPMSSYDNDNLNKYIERGWEVVSVNTYKFNGYGHIVFTLEDTGDTPIFLDAIVNIRRANKDGYYKTLTLGDRFMLLTAKDIARLRDSGYSYDLVNEAYVGTYIPVTLSMLPRKTDNIAVATLYQIIDILPIDT